MISLALCYEPTSNDGAAGGERPLLVIAERWGATAGGTGALLARPKLRSVGGLLMYAKASAFANVAQAVAVIAPLLQRRRRRQRGGGTGLRWPSTDPQGVPRARTHRVLAPVTAVSAPTATAS